ncbi:hypothetical protein MCERE10_01815 [Burkholderiaceae bacterium]
MSDQKKWPESPQATSTTVLKSGCLPEAEIHTTACNSLTTDAAIVPIVLAQHGCVMAIDWFTNHLTKQRQCRWVNRDKSLIVDIFENERQKLKISMHNSAVWQSPQDQQMPRFAKTLAFALQSAGVRCKYQQDQLSKYQTGNISHE